MQAQLTLAVMRFNRLKLATALFALIAGLVIALSPIGTALDNLAYDFNFAIVETEVSQDVVVVAIDEPSFQELGQAWPWPRSVHAKLLDSLFDAGARVVVLDLIFADPTTADAQLAESLARQGPVILATNEERRQTAQFDRVVSVQPLAAFQTKSVSLGSAALPVDADGFVRRFGSRGSTGEESLAVAAVKAFRPSLKIEPNSSNHSINFSGPAGSISQVSYYQALEPSNYLPQAHLKGKLVFVGLITQSDVLDQAPARDSYQTPHTTWGAEYMNGVEIHAQAAQSLLNGSQIKPISAGLLLLLSMLLGGLAIWGMFRFNPIKAALPAFAIGAVIIVWSYWLMQTFNLYASWPVLLLPAMAISVASPLVHYVTAQQERNFIHKAFSSYMAEPVVKQLMDNPELLKAGGSVREGSVLFLDLQGFTGMSEKMEPQAVLEMLNKYLGDLSDIAIDEGGLIDKFIGDAIMAVWGTPIADPNHASNACRAAVKMQAYLANARATESGASNLFARIGIHSGEFIAGNVGGKSKFDYTVIGDTVNLAARLESANNQFGTEILISEVTQQNITIKDFKTTWLASIQVKGREEPVVVFELTSI